MQQMVIISLDLFPTTSYKVSAPSGAAGTLPLAPGKIESDVKILFIPNLGANWQLNDKSAFGVSVHGNGLSCEYPTQTFGDASSKTTNITYYQVYIDPTYSYKINEKHSFGISAMIVSQLFEINGLNSFSALSSSPENVSGNGSDLSIGIGAKIGYLGELFEGFHLGATYQTRAFTSEFDNYKGLLAEQGSMDAPSTWTIGVNYAITDNWRALFDVQQINYSEIKSLSNPFASTGALGADNGAGFGWEDMTVFKFGTEYQLNESLALRAGYAFTEEPVRDSEVYFNIMAPMVNNQHFTLGATKQVGNKDNALNLAVTYAPSNALTGINPMDPGQQIELDLELFELELSFTF